MYNNEQLVMKKLGITSWKNLSKDKFMKFISIMPEMSDEVRIKIIEQLPQFTQLCSEGIIAAKETFQNVLDKNEQTTLALIDRINIISENISKELNKENLSFEERRFIIEQLMEIANIYNQMDERSKKFFDTVFGKILIGIGSVLGAVLVFLGGKFLLKKN